MSGREGNLSGPVIGFLAPLDEKHVSELDVETVAEYDQTHAFFE